MLKKVIYAIAILPNNGIDALRTIYREEGIAGFYRGVIPALILTSHGSIQVLITFICHLYFILIS